ncbi:hypothetical protein WN943_025662 [Citrus x changshan-huyou]
MVETKANMGFNSYLLTFILISSLLLPHSTCMAVATEAGSVSYKLKVVSKRTFRTLPPSPKTNPPSRWVPVLPPPGL